MNKQHLPFADDNISPYNECNIMLTPKHIIDILGRHCINNITIKNFNVYRQAFTHPSYIKSLYSEEKIEEWNSKCTFPLIELGEQSYERLEFLGDMELKQIIGYYLFQRYPYADEGFLTKTKTKLENKETFANWSLKLGFNRYVLLAQSVEKLRCSQSTLEDLMESFIAALLIDQGHDICRKFVHHILENKSECVVDLAQMLYQDDNYKDQLLRWFNSNNWKGAIYHVIENGHENADKKFVVGILNPGIIYNKNKTYNKSQFMSIGDPALTKKQAEQNAAKNALENYNMNQDHLLFAHD